MVIQYDKCWKPGNCKLCGQFTEHLERHHLRYKPEITIDLCHNCHFLCHFFPNRLKRYQKLQLLSMLYDKEKAEKLLNTYENNPIVLAKLFAPSRRESIHKAQKEEFERVKNARPRALL